MKIIIEYDLSRVRHLRLETAGSEDKVRIRFDYDQGSNTLGDTMPRSDAARLVKTIQDALPAVGMTEGVAAAASVAIPATPRRQPAAAAPPAPEEPPPALLSASGLALIAANLIPLAGVLFFRWSLANVMVLFWAQSAVIGFYTALKMVIVGKWAALLAVPFFVGHFGAFMAIHLLLIDGFFVRGLSAAGPEPGAREALLGIFMPIWPSLAALFISHGVSFFTNFVQRREYATTTMTALMSAPYNRIILMQAVLIFGGWIIMLLKNPVPALALLVALKTVLDFTAHRKEHGQLMTAAPAD